jgi:mono/diheme cytochrome c family protein
MAKTKKTRILAYVVLALVIIGGIGFAVLSRTKPGLEGSVADDPALVARGEYVSRLADCASCHTAINGKAYAGGLQIKSPVGTIYSSNITPDKNHGIGNYTLADFDRAVRQGVRPDGASLYPAMPYPSFARMSDADVTALYAYFMHGVTAEDEANHAEGIRWPLSMRWPLAVWRGLFAPDPAKGATAVAATDPVVARGEYLVTGPGHCGACHSPRGVALQEKSLDNKDPSFLSGGSVIDGWVVPSLRGEDDLGLGRWSVDDIARFLKTGRTDHSAVFGGMADVVAWSTQHFSDDDLHAVGTYLKTLQPDASATGKFVPDGATASLLDSGNAQGNHGAEIYQQQCAICHQNDGGGIARMFPPLAGNPIVVTQNPASLVNIVLNGAALPPNSWAPSTVAMPAYRTVLSDKDIADVTNFIRSGWGNKVGTQANDGMVATLRKDSTVSSNTDSTWSVISPQPYGDGWTFAPQTHTGSDGAR